jgi:AraC family transcriptional regulator
LPVPAAVRGAPISRRLSQPDPVRSIVLESAGEFSTRLGFYSPGAKQAPHVDSSPGVSIVITGAVEEAVGSRSQTRLPACVAVKPPCIRHSASFSPSGAIVLSVAVGDAAQWALVAPPGGWQWRRLRAPDQRLLLSWIAAPPMPGTLSQLTFELLALAAGDDRARGSPPAWLARLAEQLTEEPRASLESLAAAVGVHPVYLARAFRRWYGVPPSAYRLRARTGRALAEALFSAGGAAESAHAAGFADQSHMCRSVRSLTGLTLSRLRTFYHGAT